MSATDTQRMGSGLRVGDLVAMRHLGLEVLAGASGLDRRIEWMHVSELEDPGPWLEGGEMLIVNGFGVPEGAPEQVRYVSRLAEHRVVALGLGVRAPELHAEMIEAADELGLPLLHLPKETPFVAISHLVANANQHVAQRRLVRHLQILDTLRLHEGVRASTSERFTELERISGYRLALLSGTGRPILREWPNVPDGVHPEEFVEDGRERIVLEHGYALPVPVGRRTAAFLIAIEQGNTPAAGLSALQHIQTVAALEVLDEYRQRETRRRNGAEALAELISGQMTREQADTRLRSAGINPGEPLVLTACRATQGGVDDDELHHALCDLDLDHLMLRQDELYLLIPDRVEELEQLIHELGLTVGVSSAIANHARLAVARREALWSLANAGGTGRTQIVRFRSQDSFAHWFPADLAALRVMVNSILGPIIEYDAANSTALLETLTAFFRNQRRVAQTARELYVHDNTLSYRLKRIEAITGRDLSDVQDMSELWLALKALTVVEAPRPEQPTPT